MSNQENNMTFENYRKAEGVNCSSFGAIDPDRDGCPLLWRANELGEGEPPRDSPALSFGRAFHSAILTPAEFVEEFVALDEGVQHKLYQDALESGSKAKKFSRSLSTYKEWISEQKQLGRTVIDLDQLERIEDMRDALMRGKSLSDLLNDDDLETELSLFGSLTDHRGNQVECKGRVDALLPGKECIDLKTVASASPMSLGQFIPRFKIHVQAAFYLDLLKANSYDAEQFSFAFVDKRKPHPVTYWKVPDHMIDLGRREYKTFLGWIHDGRKSGKWAGHSPMIEFPGWFQKIIEEL